MAEVVTHACYPQSNTDTNLFRNDNNNVAAIIEMRRLKKLQEEAELLQKKLLGEAVEDKEKVQKERDELRDAKTRLEQEMSELRGAQTSSLETIENLRQNAKSLQSRIDEESKKKDEYYSSAETLKTEKTECVRQSEEYRTQRDEYSRNVATLRAERDSSSRDADSLRGERDEYSRTVSTLRAERDSHAATISNFQAEKKQLLRSAPRSNGQNSLPPKYHNATVLIVNMGTLVALDAGRDDGTTAYGHELGLDNPWQFWTLSKRDLNDDDSYWIINRKDDSNKRLYFPDAGTGHNLKVGTAPNTRDYWLIGHGSRPGGWLFRNVEFGTYIEQGGGSRFANVNVTAYEYSDRLDATWLIIPLSMDLW